MQSALEKDLIEIKRAMVVHNPDAGDGNTSKTDLVSMIRSAGFKCSYSSTKPFRWENIETADIDFIVLAGGDGTVRKIAEALLSRKVLAKKLPIGLLPFGTANNIARTLGVNGNSADIIKAWRAGKIKKFDVGHIRGLDEPTFFLESFGYGLFPRLMHQMKKQKKDDIADPKEKLESALELLYQLILTSSLRKCKLTIDEKDHSGEFLLIEVMNIRSIGPNLNLAPHADPGDNAFDVVLIAENQRDTLASYVRQKMEGRDVKFDFPLLKAKNLQIEWEGKHLHVDDQYHKLKKHATIIIEMREGLLEFLLP